MLKENKSKLLLNYSPQPKEKNIYSEKTQKILKENREKRLEMWKNH
ncbi:hypothetical protein SAMN05446037_1002156 [Anaerovirgula multivorans]|uniref:Uncharacterized protein n=1 Tax=Anaerovirgula multivorans TaxID=312168 RepID=A0A239ANF4_9FIRM|nr:hypothetical protein [Anaerovirgula multivorans]SNR97079.1 hypothetical protein SAMN05446037_1002156 [Anaerovirgula multivorans]